MAEKIRADIELGQNQPAIDLSIFPESEWLPQRLEWFQDLKVGFLMHWGLYSQAGIVESWQLSQKDEWAREPKAWRDNIEQLKLDYWNLITAFNPQKFNPDAWMQELSDAGFKYGIVTSKHHDGFNMFNTAFSEFKVCGKQSPCKVDVYREIMDAMRRHQIFPGVYYSKADWYHPDYWVDDDTIKGRHASYDTSAEPERWQRYVSFVHQQIAELTTNYGKVEFLWLDAGWCGDGKEDLQMDQLAEIARRHQPELIIVNRAMGGRHENYVTPERKVPNDDEIPTQPWESNIPIGNDWGYVPGDIIKSGDELICSLVEIVSKGGNVLFGVGPTPQGELLAAEVQSIRRLGAWLRHYGDGIYNTRAAKIKVAQSGIYLTSAHDTLNVFIKAEQCGQPISVNELLPAVLAQRVSEVQAFTPQTKVEWDKEALSFVIQTSDDKFPIYGCKLILK